MNVPGNLYDLDNVPDNLYCLDNVPGNLYDLDKGSLTYYVVGIQVGRG